MRAILVLCCLTLVFQGCTSLPKPSTGKQSGPEQAQAAGHPLDDQYWGFQGKLSIRQQGQRQTAFIRWQQRGPLTSISLTGALGQGLTQIQHNPDVGATLTHKQTKYFAESLEALLLQHLGWQFPVHQVKDWVIGRKVTQGQSQRLAPIETAFEQDSWQIKISKWQTLENTQYTAPKKISLQYKTHDETDYKTLDEINSETTQPNQSDQAVPNADLSLLLIIKKWTHNPS